MSGVYVTMMNTTRSLMNGSISLDAGLGADELTCSPPPPGYPPEYVFQRDSLTAGTPLCTGLFTTSYNLIYQLNSLLAGLAGSGGVSAPVKTGLEGEARFSRALLYFYLVNLYGDVPLVLTTNYEANNVSPRVATDSVYAQMVTDLQAAQQLLPAAYLTGPGFTGDRTRPNQAAATALLARVWLYKGQWAKAEQAASMVIADANYQLCGLDSVFGSASPEAIWQLQPVHGSMATADGYAYLMQVVAGRPPFVFTPALLGSVETGDLRQVNWMRSIVYKGQTYFYPYKYKLTMNTPGNAEYEMVLRLGEQYLIRAEARVRQGNIGGAVDDVNRIRARAGLSATTASQPAEVLAAILQERRIELMTEWGHRWLDLKRTGSIDTVLITKAGWQSKDTLYPIPASELQANPGMLQNPGY